MARAPSYMHQVFREAWGGAGTGIYFWDERGETISPGRPNQFRLVSL